MNTATILIFAAFALVALAQQDKCQLCQDAVEDVRVELGNGGKGASEQAILAAGRKVCKKRLILSVAKCDEYADSVVDFVVVAKQLLDDGHSNLAICTFEGVCKK